MGEGLKLPQLWGVSLIWLNFNRHKTPYQLRRGHSFCSFSGVCMKLSYLFYTLINSVYTKSSISYSISGPRSKNLPLLPEVMESWCSTRLTAATFHFFAYSLAWPYICIWMQIHSFYLKAWRPFSVGLFEGEGFLCRWKRSRIWQSEDHRCRQLYPAQTTGLPYLTPG